MQVPAVLEAGAIPALCAMLVPGTEPFGGALFAVDALRAICASPVGRDAAVAAGVPAALTTVMATCDSNTRNSAARILLLM